MPVGSAPRAAGRYRAGAHAYIVWTVVFGGTTVAAVWGALYQHPDHWQAVGLFAFLLCFSLIWAKAFEIRITDDELVFRSLFGGTRRIALADIRAIRLSVDVSGKGGILQLLVGSKDRNAQTMSINAKVFTSEAVRAVLDLGKQVSTSDSGDLDDGILMRTVRKRPPRKTRRGA